MSTSALVWFELDGFGKDFNWLELYAEWNDSLLLLFGVLKINQKNFSRFYFSYWSFALSLSSYLLLLCRAVSHEISIIDKFCFILLTNSNANCKSWLCLLSGCEVRYIILIRMPHLSKPVEQINPLSQVCPFLHTSLQDIWLYRNDSFLSVHLWTIPLMAEWNIARYEE